MCSYVSDERSFVCTTKNIYFIPGSYDCSLRVWSAETMLPLQSFQMDMAVMSVCIKGDDVYLGLMDQA